MASNDVYTHRSFFEDNVEVPKYDFITWMDNDGNRFSFLKTGEVERNPLMDRERYVLGSQEQVDAFRAALPGDLIKERKDVSDHYDKIMNKTLRRL